MGSAPLNVPCEFILFYIAFFCFMVIANAMQARRKMEKTYCLGTVVSIIMVLAFASVLFNHVILGFSIFAVTIILSASGLLKILKIQKQEITKQLQRVDLSSPFNLKDFFKRRVAKACI